jgi:hypothetical protein
MVSLKTRFVTEGKHFPTESRKAILPGTSALKNIVSARRRWCGT